MAYDIRSVLDKPFPSSVKLPALGPFTPVHVFDEPSVWAVKAALAAERPLLVCGEPGTGKSQLARAAAAVLNRPLVPEVVTSRTEPQDLLWRYDAVARLAEAQVLSLTLPAGRAAPADGSRAPELERLDAMRYVTPGPLWWVFDWEEAERQRGHALVSSPVPEKPDGWKPDDGVVALIDEIDKADLDLPNSLLECLGNGEFHLPHRAEPVRCRPGRPPPLVVITTNRERQLPPAFVRRCLVLELALPKKAEELIGWLITRGKAHFGKKCPEDVLTDVAKGIAERRKETQAGDCPQPGLAEYLDLLRVLVAHAPNDAARQRDILRSVSGFVYDKRSGFEV